MFTMTETRGDTMSLIDWSDPEEMLGLLVEYVRDETAAAHADVERARFLDQLSRELEAVAGESCDSLESVERALLGICDSQPVEFADDPVMTHVEACIEEIRRIASARS